jgi:protease I
VKSFVTEAKPVAAICHGPWSLVEAGVVSGKTLTSWPSLQTDIRNAGGAWVDQEVNVCPASGWTLVTSRNPDDLDAFCSTLVEQFAR